MVPHDVLVGLMPLDRVNTSSAYSTDSVSEGLVLHGRANNMLMAISRALLTPACILAIVAAIQHMWLGFGSSVYHLVLSNDKSQPERYGGITKVKDWPVLGAGSVMGDE